MPNNSLMYFSKLDAGNSKSYASRNDNELRQAWMYASNGLADRSGVDWLYQLRQTRPPLPKRRSPEGAPNFSEIREKESNTEEFAPEEGPYDDGRPYNRDREYVHFSVHYFESSLISIFFLDPLRCQSRREHELGHLWSSSARPRPHSRREGQGPSGRDENLS